MPEYHSKDHVIILCDSWHCTYAYRSAGTSCQTWKTSFYENDFMFSGEKIGDYYTGIRRGLTKIFGNREVLAYSNPLK